VTGPNGPVAAVRLSRWQRATLGLAAGLLVVTTLTGPYLVVQQSVAANQQLRAVRASDADIQHVLALIVAVTSGPKAKAARDATVWYVREFMAICAAEPGCQQVPLPADLQADGPAGGP
jgi:hypothetical protein